MISEGRAVCIALAAMAFSLPVATAQAQEDNQAAARALFHDGRALVDAGQFAAACPKFEAAEKLYVSAGTVLSLADCYEQIGHTASAWAEFGDAASIALRTGRQDAAAEAQRRQGALEPKLTRLIIRAPADIPGLVVMRDGAELAPAAWGTAIPVDPGAHQIAAVAPGRLAWSSQVTADGAGRTTTADVPELGMAEAEAATTRPAGGTAPSAPVVSPEPAIPAAAGRTQRMIGWIMGGAGVVGAGVGGIVGLVAKSQYDTANRETGPARRSDSESAVGTGNAATAIVCVGAAVAAAGVVIWLTAPRPPAALGTNGHELFVRTTF